MHSWHGLSSGLPHSVQSFVAGVVVCASGSVIGSNSAVLGVSTEPVSMYLVNAALHSFVSWSLSQIFLRFGGYIPAMGLLS